MKRFIILLLYCLSWYEATSQEKFATDFDFTLQNGQIENLSSYRGQVLYISFWASWCQPCLQNFQKYRALRSQLQDVGVVLLNINIDKDKQAWVNTLQKINTIEGVHGRGQFIEDLIRQYGLSSIPTYEIIDKKGQFVYLSEQVNRDIVAEFKKWIDE